MAPEVADHLYEASLSDFTRARDEIAAKLKAAGDDDAARAVKTLKKPTVAAWAVNQVARRHSDDVKELLALRDDLADASGAALREVGEKRRRLLARLVKHAESILRDSGHAPTGGTLEKVTQTFQAGATDEEVELLRTGTLTRELSPSGFAGMDWSDAASWTAPPASKATSRAREKADELAAAAEEKEAEARELEKAAELARKHAEAAAHEAEVARRNADRARERADAAAARLG
ncbi:MAG TPA: hypothetical protein VIG64_04715 [Actinomycetota bacterium]|jgi:hypothetical protein